MIAGKSGSEREIEEIFSIEAAAVRMGRAVCAQIYIGGCILTSERRMRVEVAGWSVH